jgi:hypothetical protein
MHAAGATVVWTVVGPHLPIASIADMGTFVERVRRAIEG